MAWSEDETVIVGECGCGFDSYNVDAIDAC
jgi:hypothetical protein